MNDDRHREKEYLGQLETYSSLLADSVLVYIKNKSISEKALRKEAEKLLKFLRTN